MNRSHPPLKYPFYFENSAWPVWVETALWKRCVKYDILSEKVFVQNPK